MNLFIILLIIIWIIYTINYVVKRIKDYQGLDDNQFEHIYPYCFSSCGLCSRMCSQRVQLYSLTTTYNKLGFFKYSKTKLIIFEIKRYFKYMFK